MRRAAAGGGASQELSYCHRSLTTNALPCAQCRALSFKKQFRKIMGLVVRDHLMKLLQKPAAHYMLDLCHARCRALSLWG